MVQIALASNPDVIIHTFKSVYDYAQEELKARIESNSPMVHDQKAIASAMYICLKGKKLGRKTLSVLYKDYIVPTRPIDWKPRLSKKKAI
jgi:hypothetical protein